MTGPNDELIKEIQHHIGTHWLVPKIVAALGGDPTYLIWSHEHGGWWGPERCGYYQTVRNAGRYSRDEAMKVCHGAGWRGGWKAGAKAPNEIPVLERDALELERMADKGPITTETTP